jgi:hypothetical protein
MSDVARFHLDAIIVSSRRLHTLLFSALITPASGVANLYRAMNPAPPARHRASHEILPLEFLPYSSIIEC